MKQSVTAGKKSKGVNGVRLDPKCDERTRAKIQTANIINRLENFVQGGCDMSPAQVTAALGLLRKTLPDMASLEQKIEGTVQTILTDPIMPEDEWADRYTNKDVGTA